MTGIIGIAIGLTLIAASFKWRFITIIVLYGALFGFATTALVSIAKADPAHIYVAYMAGSVASGFLIDKEREG